MFSCCCSAKDGDTVDLQLNPAFSAEDPVLLMEPEVTPFEAASVPQAVEVPLEVIEEPSTQDMETTSNAAVVEDATQHPPELAPEVAPELEEDGLGKADAAPVDDVPVEEEVRAWRDFQISIKKDHKDSPIGLELDTVGARCGMVMQVMEGAVRNYNSKASAEDKVCAGDFIIAVNGIRGDTKAMAQQAVQDLKLELLFRRPSEFIVVLDKTRPGAPKSCGMDLEYLGIGRTLLIQDIKDGLIEEWNEAHPKRRVKIGDRIVSVNAFAGEAEKMLELCTRSQTLELKIARA